MSASTLTIISCCAPGDELPAGYIRYTTTEEKTMLHQVAEDYEVDPGICDWICTATARSAGCWTLRSALGLGILLLVVGSVIVGGVKKAVWGKEQNTFEP